MSAAKTTLPAGTTVAVTTTNGGRAIGELTRHYAGPLERAEGADTWHQPWPVHIAPPDGPPFVIEGWRIARITPGKATP